MSTTYPIDTTTTGPLKPLDIAKDMLERGIKDLLASGDWKAWLDVKTKFHNYSFNNCMLIFLQRPDSTRVTGYGAKDGSTGWLSLGRQVRKGERAIKIFAPMLVKDKDSTNPKAKKLIGFKIVNVFDVAQTDGDPLPEPPVEHLTGEDSFGLWDLLLDLADSEGVPVTIGETPRDVGGYLDPKARCIVIDQDKDRAHQTKTLIHELAHALDPDLSSEDADPLEYQQHRGKAEVVAESVAYLVAHTMGWDTGQYSFGYVAEWADGKVDVIKAVAARVDKVARLVLKALDAREAANA